MSRDHSFLEEIIQEGAMLPHRCAFFGNHRRSDLVRTDICTAQRAAVLQQFTYDNDGNLESDGLWNYQWEAENRLVAWKRTASRSA